MKQKNNKKKYKYKVKNIIFFILLILLGIGIFNFSLNLTIRDVILKGNEYLSYNEVISYTSLNDNTKVITFMSSTYEKQLIESPYIKSVEIDKNFFGDVEILIEENKPLFINNNDTTVILESKEEANYRKDFLGLPTLTNSIEEDVFSDFINALLVIDFNLLYKISEISYEPNIKDGIVLDNERFIFKMNDGNTVHVNLVNIEKFLLYDDICEIEKSKGTIYLDSSNEGHIFDLY